MLASSSLRNIDRVSNGALQRSQTQQPYAPRMHQPCNFDPLTTTTTRKILRTFEIRHVSPDICIQRIDDHLAVGRASDLNPSVHQARRGIGSPPRRIITDVFGLGQEVREDSFVDFSLAEHAALEKLLAGLIEGSMEGCEEGAGFLGEDLAGSVADGAENLDVHEEGIDWRGHDRLLGGCMEVWVRMCNGYEVAEGGI